MFPWFLFFLLIQHVDFDRLRRDMVTEQLEARDIRDQHVLDAMRRVKRHLFVPRPYQSMAYRDGPLPIGQDQTISQPYIVAFMTQVIEPQANFKVLEIGTGSGYQAAILGEIVDEVYTIEIVAPLGQLASDRMVEMGYQNVHVRVGDGYEGWPEQAPFDAIIVTAAPEEIPQPLIDQLKEGGRMVIPVGPEGSIQYLKLVEKEGGKVKEKDIFPVRFVPFTRD